MEVFTKHVSMKKVSKDLQSNLVSTIYNQIMTSNLVSITQNKLEQQLTGISCTTIYLLSQSQSMLRLSCIQSPRHGLIGKELDQSSDHSSAKVARTLHSLECFSTSVAGSMSAGKHDCVYRSIQTNFATICIFLWVCNLWVFSLWFCSNL